MKYRDVLPSHKFCQECSFYIFPSKLNITQFPLRCVAPHDAPIASVRQLYALDGRKTNCRKFYRVDLKCDEVRSHIKSRSAFVIIARQRDRQINQALGKTSEKTHKNSEHGASGSLCVRFDFVRWMFFFRKSCSRERTVATYERKPMRSVLSCLSIYKTEKNR